MPITCPNKASKAWKELVNSVGENKAYGLWNEYNGNVPQEYYQSEATAQGTITEIEFPKTNKVSSFAQTNQLDTTETFVEKRGDKTYKFLFDKADNFGITINDTVVNSLEMSKLGINPAKGLAFYEANTNQIKVTSNFLKLSKYDQARILAHESIHGLVRNKLNQMDDINKEFIENSFNNFIEKVKNNKDLQKFSSVKRVMSVVDRDGYEELITYGLTDPEFAAALNGVVLGLQEEDSKVTFWQKLKELILSIISDDYTLFDEFMDLLDSHFEITEDIEEGVYDISTGEKITIDPAAAQEQFYDRKLAELPEEEGTSIHQKIVDSDINTNTKVFKETETKLKSFLNNVGIKYENIENITDYEGSPIDAVAKADIINKIIQVNEGKRDFTTLPEESAHIFVKLLGENSPLYQSMMEKIPRFKIYQEVKKEYNNAYDSEKQLREEAIAKLISREIINEEEIDDTALNRDLFSKWWNRLWNFIKSLLGGIKSNEMGPFIKSAKMILNGEIDGLLSLNKVIELNQDDLKGLVYYQLSNEAINRKDQMNKDFEQSKVSFNYNTNKLETADGREIKFRLTDFKERYYINKNYRIDNTEKKEMVSLKGVYTDALNKEIMDKLIVGEDIVMDDIINTVSNRLLNSSERINEIYNSKENDRHFFDMTLDQFNELKNGVEALYKQIQSNSDRIKKYTEGATGKPKIYTGLSLYYDKEDIAETIDILVVYPNSSVGVYKYEATNFYEGSETGEIKELSRTQIEGNEIILQQAKRILKAMYGLEELDFAESRIVPINIQLNYKSKFNPTGNLGKGLAKVEMGSNEDRLYLEQIPVAKELITEDAPLSKSLKRMINLRSNLKSQLDSHPGNHELRVQFNKIDKAIKDLQLNREANTIYNEVYNMFTQLRKLESEPTESPNYDYGDFNNYIMFAEVFEGMSNEISDSSGGTILTKDNKEKLGKITNMAQAIKTIATRKILDRIKEYTGRDLSKDILESGTLGNVFKQLQDYDGQIFKRMADLVEVNSEHIRQDFNRVHDIMMTKHKSLQKWARSKNISIMEAFKKIYDVNKRGLVSKYTGEYFKDLNNARKNRKLKWLQDNLELLPEKEAQFNENKISYFNYLDKIYPDEINSKDKLTELGEYNKKQREALKLEWEKKFDIKKHPSTALMNKRNGYLTLKENAKYYSDEWKELINPENKPLLDYYNQYIEFNQYFNNLTNRDIKRGFVSELRQDTLDRIFQAGIGAAGNIWRQMMHSLETREFDISERQVDASTGEILPVIPLLYTDPVRDALNDTDKVSIKRDLENDGFERGTEVYNSEYQRRVKKLEYQKGAEYKSFDLTKSLLLFANSIFTHKHFTDTVEEIKAIQNLIKSDLIETKLTAQAGNPLVNKLTGEYAKKIGLAKSDIEAFDNFVNTYWYGLELETKDHTFKGKSQRDENGIIISEGKKYSGTKIYRMLSKLTTFKALPLNIVAAGGNVLGLHSNFKIMAAEGLRFNNKQANKAFNMILTKNKKAVMLAKYFEPHNRSLNIQKANDLTGNKINKWFTSDRIMSLYRIPDDFYSEVTLISMMQNYGLNSNNEIQRLDKLPEDSKSLFDLAEIKDDKVTLPGISDNETNFLRLRRMSRNTFTGIAGVPSEDNKNNTGKNILVKVLMKFRSWIPGLAKARFRNMKFDEDMQEFDVGRYRVVAGEFARSGSFRGVLNNFFTLMGQAALSTPILNRLTGRINLYKNGGNSYANKVFFESFLEKNKELRGKVSFENFEEVRAAKMAGIAKELSTMLFYFLVAGLAKHLIPDDDEEYIARFFGKNTYKILHRGLLELNFWTSPESMLEVSKSPAADLGTLRDIYRWYVNTLDVTKDLITPDADIPLIQKKGARAIFEKTKYDKSPMFYRTLNVMPFGGNIVDFLDLFDEPI